MAAVHGIIPEGEFRIKIYPSRETDKKFHVSTGCPATKIYGY